MWLSVGIGLGAIVVIAWLTVVVRVLRTVVRSRMETGKKIGWIALTMSSQPLGVLLWHLVGRRHAERVTK